jgi:hypothetical protein
MSPLKSADSIKSRFKKRMQQKSTPYENVFWLLSIWKSTFWQSAIMSSTFYLSAIWKSAFWQSTIWCSAFRKFDRNVVPSISRQVHSSADGSSDDSKLCSDCGAIFPSAAAFNAHRSRLFFTSRNKTFRPKTFRTNSYIHVEIPV